MAQLDVLLDLLAQFIAVLARHGDIAQYDIGFCCAHLLKGGLCIETGDETVVLREEQAHVVDDFRVVIHDEDGGALIVVCRAVCMCCLQERCGIYDAEVGEAVVIQRLSFLAAVGFLIHGENQCEDGTRGMFPVAGGQ